MKIKDQNGIEQQIVYLIYQNHYPTGGVWQITTKRIYDKYDGARKIEFKNKK